VTVETDHKTKIHFHNASTYGGVFTALDGTKEAMKECRGSSKTRKEKEKRIG